VFTRDKIIEAGLNLWEAKGEQAVTARQIGKAIGVTGQRVHNVAGNMTKLRERIAREAVRTNRIAIILQMQAARHPLAPPIDVKRLL